MYYAVLMLMLMPRMSAELVLSVCVLFLFLEMQTLILSVNGPLLFKRQQWKFMAILVFSSAGQETGTVASGRDLLT